MENLNNQTKKLPTALVMSEPEWQKVKHWLKQFPGYYCIPTIELLERYLKVIPPVPPGSPDPSALMPEPNKVGLEPNGSPNNTDNK